MSGESDLGRLLAGLTPTLNPGTYVFLSVEDEEIISRRDTLFEFKEAEGITLVVKQEVADDLGLSYEYLAAWITLKIHSSLEAVGLTAAFSNALAKGGISCNVVAGYYHDHIFVDRDSALAAMEILAKFGT